MGGYLPPMFDPIRRKPGDPLLQPGMVPGSIATPPFLPPDMEEPPDLPPATVPTAQGVPTADDWEDPVADAEAAYEKAQEEPDLKRVPWWRKVLAGVADKNVFTSGTELGPWLRYGHSNLEKLRSSDAGRTLAKVRVENAREAAKRKADREKALREGYEAETGRQTSNATVFGEEQDAANEAWKRKQYNRPEEVAKRWDDAGYTPPPGTLPEGATRKVTPMNMGKSVAYPKGPGETHFDEAPIPPGDGPPDIKFGAPGATPYKFNRETGQWEAGPQNPMTPSQTKAGGDSVDPKKLDAEVRLKWAEVVDDAVAAREKRLTELDNDPVQDLLIRQEFARSLQDKKELYQSLLPPGAKPLEMPPVVVATPFAAPKPPPGWAGPLTEEPPALPGTTAAPAAKAAPTSPQTTSDQEIRDALLAEDPTMTAEELERAVAAYKQIQ